MVRRHILTGACCAGHSMPSHQYSQLTAKSKLVESKYISATYIYPWLRSEVPGRLHGEVKTKALDQCQAHLAKPTDHEKPTASTVLGYPNYQAAVSLHPSHHCRRRCAIGFKPLHQTYACRDAPTVPIVAEAVASSYTTASAFLQL